MIGMDMQIISLNDKKKWNEYVFNHKDSIAWHCYEWSEIVGKHYDVEFYPLAAIDGEYVKGILPLYMVNGMLVSVAYAVAGGILADDRDVERSLLNKSIEMANSKNIKKIVFKQYKNSIDADLSTDENYYNKELDLTDSIENIRNNFGQFNRKILDGMNELDYSLDFSSENIDIFYKMLFNHSHKQGIPCPAKNWIHDLINFKMYKIGILKKGNSILSGTLIKEFKSTVSFPFTCFPGNKKNMNNVYYLYWMLIKKFAGDGLTVFHSGRIPKTDETNRYRLGWGGIPFNYYYQYYPKESGNTEYGAKRGLKRKIFNTVWKITPGSITKFFNDKITAKFP